MKNKHRNNMNSFSRRDRTDLSTIAPSIADSVAHNARMHGHNTQMGGTGWRVSARVPTKPYQPTLRDAYPRNEYTMMPQQTNAPKYYDGKFMTFDYRDMVQPAAPESSRPVVFKSQDIERVQTRKKYGLNLKGESSVPLHLCNDTSSELFQRSLNPQGYKQDSEAGQNPRRVSELRQIKEIVDKYPGGRNRRAKNDMSALNPLGYTTQRWIDSTFPSSTYSRTFSRRSNNSFNTTYEDNFDNRMQASRKIPSPSLRSEPEWYSDFFPKDKVASTLKFMGQAPAVHHKAQRNREYDINFNGNY